jgi:hypothetical protein
MVTPPQQPPQQLSLFDAPPPLTREQAIEALRPRLGQDLRALADQYGLTTPGEVPLNKGWAGLTVERLLGLPPNNDQGADFGEWELKVAPLKRAARGAQAGAWRVKGPLALTQCPLSHISEATFERSHLWVKCRRMLIAFRLYEGSEEERSPLFGLAPLDLTGSLREELEREYEAMRWALRAHGVMGLRDAQGRLLSLQDQGAYKSWSFYALRPLIEEAFKRLITAPHP